MRKTADGDPFPTSTPIPTVITISPEEAPGEFLEALPDGPGESDIAPGSGRMEFPDFKPLLGIVAPLEIGTVIWQLVPGSLPQLSKQRSRRPDETPFFCF